jgi:hypothetical protein
VGQLLAERGQSLASAEAGTQGHLAERLMALGDSAVLRTAQLDGHPQASAPEMAQAARLGPGAEADWGLGLVLREMGGSKQFEMALAGQAGLETHSLGYGGHPDLAVRWAATAALNLLRLALTRPAWPPPSAG